VLSLRSNMRISITLGEIFASVFEPHWLPKENNKDAARAGRGHEDIAVLDEMRWPRPTSTTSLVFNRQERIDHLQTDKLQSRSLLEKRSDLKKQSNLSVWCALCVSSRMGSA
jgi:hypothetical protein